MGLLSNLMKKYPFIVVAVILILVTILDFAAPASTYDASQEKSSHPNIIFIRTDDQNYRSLEYLKPDGSLVMQNVEDLIAKKGATFTNSFTSYSLCCPSRATFLTGQYAHNHNVKGNFPPYGGYTKFDPSSTLAVWLQNSGYKTIHLGKYLNGYGDGFPTTVVPPGWSEWFTLNGATRYYDYKITDNGVIKSYGSQPADYASDVLTAKAVDYILNMSSQPFFLVLDYPAPHTGSPGNGSAVPAPRHDGMMANFTPSFLPSFNEYDISDKPKDIQNLPLMDGNDTAQLTYHIQRALESLIAVDEGVKAIVDALAQTGKLKNTYIIFTSDNGYQEGEHRIASAKSFAYEESIRVPLIMRGRSIKPGIIIDSMVVNIDYAPTIAELAGVTAPYQMDGVSFLRLLRNPAAHWRSDFLLENYQPPPFQHAEPYLGLRTENYAYVEYDYDKNSVGDELELYNFEPDRCHAQSDRYQLESQHNNPCYRNIIAKFHNRLNGLKNCSGLSCH